jgi:uncharacterized membrane-anchored protein
MSRLRPWLIVGAAVLLAGALIWLILSEHQARAEGTEVRLALGGVDPRSLLSGHYVQLAFTDTPPKGVACPPRVWTGRAEDRKWVALRVTEGRARVAGEAPTREAAQRLAPIVVRGNISCWGARSETETLALDIGLDRFHASQKEAQAIEAALRSSSAAEPTAFALVSIGKDGRARLKGLEVEGRRITLDWFSPAA